MYLYELIASCVDCIVLDPHGENSATFVRNIIGTATGMLMFRESLRGTCGENVYRCFKDIDAWRRIEDTTKKMYWKYAIRNKYISQDGSAQVKSRVKVIVYQGM